MATTPRQGLPTTPTGFLALQRAAGNAAVSRAVTTERHAAGGAGHAQGPVAGTGHGGGLPVSAPSDRRDPAAEENARMVLSGPAPTLGTGPTAGRHQRHEGRAHHGEGLRDAVIQRAPAAGESLSARVLQRLRVANDAIRQVQADTRHAANQQEALIQTVYNSSLRAIVQQHDGFWDLSRLPSGTNRSELAAAKALYARSMICETAAACTFSYLRRRAAGEELMMVVHPQQSHWFVIIGGENEDPSEWVVADPWPTQARAVEWKDHFCYSPGLESVFVDRKMRADGNDTARHLAHLIDLNSAGWYVARWDLGRLDGRTNLEIGRMLQRAAVEIDLHRDDLAEQIMQGLAYVDSWPTDDIGTWPIEQLEVWCLAQIDVPIVSRLLARPESSGNSRDLRQEIAGGIREVRQEQGDSSWIWDIRHTHAQGRNP